MEENKVEILPTPTQNELDTQKWVYQAFDVMWENNNRPYEQFNGRTVKDYVDNGRSAINIMNRPREDGRSNVKSITPLNKLLAILARTSQKRPDIHALAVNRSNLIDNIRSKVIKDLYDWSYQNMQNEIDQDMEYFFKGFDTQIDGTFIGYEGFDNQTHKHRVITEYNPDTGDVKYEEKEFKTNQCFNQQVKVTDFFIWNPYLRSVQKQPKVCWRTVYDRQNFDNEFSGYKKHKYVKEGAFSRNDQADPIYQNNWQNRVKDNQIEVLRMFDKRADRMVIIANGVILQDTPMIWKNGEPKKYPFAYTIRQPFAGGEFFWGMHLWHVLEGDVTALETLFNIGIEQEKLATNPPMLKNSANEIEDENLTSGRILDVDDIDGIRELKFSGVGQGYDNMMDRIGRNIDFSSVDAASQGQNIPDTTARGQVIAEENARKLLSNFTLMMENLVLQEAKLRIPNIIQFQFIPGAQFRVENVDVDGENGIRELKILGPKREGEETEEEVEMIEQTAKIHGINLERMNLTFNYLEGIKYNLKVLKESSFQSSKSLDIAQFDQFMATTAQLFPEIFKQAQEVFFKEYVTKRDIDPNKFLEAAQSQGGNTKMLEQLQQMTGGKAPSQSPIGPTTGLGGVEK